MQLIGYEEVSYYYGSSTSASGSSTSRHHYNKSEFLKVSAALGPPGQLPPGQYQFAFKISLPPDLPATFLCNRGSDRGEVAYQLKAHVAKPGFDIKATAPVLVRQHPPLATHATANSAQDTINCCCCFSQGTAAMQAAADKDIYVAGESVRVTVQAKNSSSARFKAVEVQLKRCLVLSAYGNPASGYSNYKSIDTLVKVKAPGLGPGEAAEGPGARSVTLALPPDLPGTSMGNLLQAWYWVEAILDGGVGKTALRVRVPVGIVPAVPAGAGPQYATPPQGWAPREHDTVHLEASRIPVQGAVEGATPAPAASGDYPPPAFTAA